MYTIYIDSLVLRGFHGVFDEERVLGNDFQFNLKVKTLWKESFLKDDLTGGVDYSYLVRIIEEENENPSKLLEHLASRIVNRIYKEYSSIEKLKLKISKLNPPIKSKMDGVSIEIEQ